VRANFLHKGAGFLKAHFFTLTVICLFVVLFSSFLLPTGELAIRDDGRKSFGGINYYLNTFWRGHYPFWDPFNVLGRTGDFFLRGFGEFNPVYQLIFLLRFLGVSAARSFLVTLTLYFLSGMGAFYLLCRALFNDRLSAAAGTMCLMFSLVSTEYFANPVVLYGLIPSIWIFYFMTRFFQTFKGPYLLGLVFAVMIAAITYLPYYLLTVICAFLLFYCLLFPIKMWIQLKGLWAFIGREKRLSAFAFFSFLVGLIPGGVWYVQSKAGEFFVNWRNPASGGRFMHIPLDTIQSSIPTYYSLKDLYFFLERAIAGYFYVPVFVFIILLCGALTRPTKKNLLLLGVTAVITLIGLGGVTPVHGWLYHHVFFFRSFRNLHFYLWPSVTAGILLMTGQLASLLNTAQRPMREKGAMFFFLSILHAAFYAVLVQQTGVVIWTLITVFLSWLFFLLYYFWPSFSKRSFALWFLGAVILVQPLYVWGQMKTNIQPKGYAYTKDPPTFEESKPRFQYLRPEKEKVSTKKIDAGMGKVSDTSGLDAMTGRFTGSKLVYDLTQQTPLKALKDYVRYKFVLYDRVVQIADEKEAITRVIGNMIALKNEAVISADSLGVGAPLQEKQAHPVFVGQDDGAVTVTDFEVNRIVLRTNVSKNVFLVYNDAYHSKWRADIDGAAVPVYQANAAFKGVFLPAGEHIVRFQFRETWWYWLYRCIALYYVLMLIVVTRSFYVMRKEERACQNGG